MKTVRARLDDADLVGTRLDVFLADRMGLFSRSQAKARVLEARVNGSAARLSRKLKHGDVVEVDFTDAPPVNAVAQDMPLSIIFENDDVVVLDKAQGMVVHPGSGNQTGTLVNALLFHCRDLAREFGGEDLRPGIVHRLDKETSGVIIAAKNPRAHAFLASQFKARRAKKRYLAVLRGRPPLTRGKVESRIARDPVHRKLFVCSESRGRTALTYYQALRVYHAPSSSPSRAASTSSGYCLVSLQPKTGRTHQLRVHMRYLSTPILGDSIYGRPDPLFPEATLMLHAHRLAVTLPGENAPRVFTAPLPARMRVVLEMLQSFSPR
jgi:23S rRNA pseudouridine1911/1915/1917 synthase